MTAPSTHFCSVPDCPSPPRARGLCWTHYKRWYTHGDPLTVLRIHDPGRRCSVDGCQQWVALHGWCRRHYMRWYRYGDPLTVLKRGRPRKVA